MAAGERSIWRVLLYAEAENIEQADAVSAAAVNASLRGGDCVLMVRFERWRGFWLGEAARY